MKPGDTHVVWSSHGEANVSPIRGASWAMSFKVPAAPACEPLTKKLPDNLHGAGLPLVSQRIREWLEPNPALTFTPVAVGTATYFILATTSRLNCINWKQAEVEWFRGKTYASCAVRARRLTLWKANVTAGQWMSPEGFPTVVMVPIEAVTKPPKAITGLWFEKPSSYRFELPSTSIAPKKPTAVEKAVLKRVEAIAKELAHATKLAKGDKLERVADDTWAHDGIASVEEEFDEARREIAMEQGQAVFTRAFIAALRTR